MRNRLPVLGIACAALTGCATIAGLPVSPATGAVGGVVHSTCSGWDRVWGVPLGFSAGALMGPIMAVSIGVSADVGWVSGSGYGVGGKPVFWDVFDPYGYALAGRESEAGEVSPSTSAGLRLDARLRSPAASYGEVSPKPEGRRRKEAEAFASAPSALRRNLAEAPQHSLQGAGGSAAQAGLPDEQWAKPAEAPQAKAGEAGR